MSNRAGLGVLTMLALACSVARAEDGHTSAPENPDLSFLEFLGSVDRLADVNPDYLSQPDKPKAGKARANDPVASPPPPPTAASGVKNND
ncbi:MAG: hypothetical protein ACHQD6_01010 [Steroidobacterales bacterium]|jgi:hypothetical protein